MEEQGASTGTFFYVLQDTTRILFVDDDPIMREFGAVHLSTDSAQVMLASDGIEALETIAEHAPDIMLLDLEMPRLDGFGVLAALRADAATRDLPVIVVTGREDIEAIDRAFQAGATSFLVKPINWRLLSYQIRYVLRAGRVELPAPADATLRGLAREGAELVRQAMRGPPDIRRSAIRYGSLLADAVDLARVPRPVA